MNELLERLKKAEARAQELAEMAELSEEQSKEFDTRMAEIKEVKSLIEAKEQRMADLKSCGVVELEERLAKPTSRPVETETKTEKVIVGEKRCIYKKDELGVFYQDIMRSAKSMRNTGMMLPRLSEQQKELRAASGMNESAPSDGGFLVQKDHLESIEMKMYNRGAVASRARRFQISANSNGIKIPVINETSRVNGSRHGGVRGYWADEAAEKTASQPTFAQLELNLNKLVGLVYATDELLQDASALQSFVSEAMSDELQFKLEDAIINGTGAGQPLGVLNAAALVSVAKEAAQAADTIVPENLFKMYSRMYAPSRSNAVWFINQDIEPQLFALALAVGTGGSPIYMPAGGISAAPYGTLFGRPVVPVEYMATVGDAGDILFADMSQYLIAEKGGMQSAMSIHVKFVYDETVLRFVYRVDGQPYWRSALTPYKGSNTQSPFVSLAERA